MATLTLAVSSCSLLDEQGQTGPIEIPKTNALITEAPPSSLPPTETSGPRPSRSYAAAPEDSYEQAITGGRRVSLSDYRRGATSATADRLNNLSGTHFMTPDRAVRCSTGNNGAGALVCASHRIDGPVAAPPNSPEGCTWAGDLAVLNARGASSGGCSNLYPVLYRSQILEYGETIVVDQFSCLSQVEGLYCLSAPASEGFAITSEGLQKIYRDERAPHTLLGENPPESPSASRPTR